MSWILTIEILLENENGWNNSYLFDLQQSPQSQFLSDRIDSEILTFKALSKIARLFSMAKKSQWMGLFHACMQDSKIQ